MKSTRSSGFTLIELMIAIAIIGILSMVVYAALGQARSKGRDSRRVGDIKQLQGAVQNYFSSCYRFPDSISVLDRVSSDCPNYLPVFTELPKDLAPGTGYRYYTDTEGAGGAAKRFHLCATLENAVGAGKGKAGIEPFDADDDPCDGEDDHVFDVIGGTY